MVLTAVKKTLASDEVKNKNVEKIKENAQGIIHKKLAHYKEVARENNTSHRKHHDRDEVR